VHVFLWIVGGEGERRVDMDLCKQFPSVCIVVDNASAKVRMTSAGRKVKG
jgi:hypothetical protein